MNDIDDLIGQTIESVKKDAYEGIISGITLKTTDDIVVEIRASCGGNCLPKLDIETM